MKKTKKYFENKILETLQEAHNAGYTIAVGSDPEGNNFNRLNPTTSMLYSGTKKKTIVLAPWQELESEDLFEEDSDELLEAHMEEMTNMEAEPTNLGWATGEDFIESKTTKGILKTEKIAKKYVSTWHRMTQDEGERVAWKDEGETGPLYIDGVKQNGWVTETEAKEIAKRFKSELKYL